MSMSILQARITLDDDLYILAQPGYAFQHLRFADSTEFAFQHI
jgi:hypothetical protein